jgi:hypothetical protein
MIAGELLRDGYLTAKAGGEGFSERDEEAVLPLAGFAGWRSTTRARLRG